MRKITSTVLAVLIICSCGGGSDPTGTSGDPNSRLKATIDGTPWVSSFSAAAASANGLFSISGSNVSSSVTAMSLTLYYIGAPGTYPLGVGGTVAGGIGVLSGSGNSWATALTGAAGSVTITAVSPTRIAGTFSFSAAPQIGQVTTARAVTQGEFDIPVSGPATLAVPDNLASAFTGTIAGNAYNAATIVRVTNPSSGTLTMGTSTTAYSTNLILSGYTGVGTYTMGAGASRTFQVTNTATNKVWGGTNSTTSGTVTITSSTSTRVKGSFSLTLQPSLINPGEAPITVTGTFELGIT